MKLKTMVLVLGMALPPFAAASVPESAPEKSQAPVERSETPKKKDAGSVPRPRGELLYENHCLACHTSRAHIRDNRRAKSEAEVQGWVRRWADETKLGWNAEDVNDVTSYLVKRYYKFGSAPAR